MANVKWIKLDVDMFSNPKIRRLKRMPDGDKIILIWVMLLTMAGRCNASGMIFITQNIPYSVEDLSDELGFSVDTVRLAIRAFEEMGMLSTNDNNFEIVNWTEHQSEEGLEKIRKNNAERQAKFREKQKTLQLEKSNVTNNVTRNVTDNVTVTHLSYSNSISNSISYSYSNNSNIDNIIYMLNSDNSNENNSYINNNEELFCCIKNWLQYKDEKKPKTSNHYTESGLKTLIKRFVENDKIYGTYEISVIVDDSIANNYQGILWEKLSNKNRKTTNSGKINWDEV